MKNIHFIQLFSLRESVTNINKGFAIFQLQKE